MSHVPLKQYVQMGRGAVHVLLWNVLGLVGLGPPCDLEKAKRWYCEKHGIRCKGRPVERLGDPSVHGASLLEEHPRG